MTLTNRTRRFLSVSIGAAILAIAPSTAWTKPTPPSETPASRPAKRVQRLIYDEDETVEAGRATGEGDIVDGPRRKKMSSLIKIREDFIPELIKSAEDI